MREGIWNFFSVLFTTWLLISFAMVVGHVLQEIALWLRGVWS
jgi:hypothetical protein